MVAPASAEQSKAKDARAAGRPSCIAFIDPQSYHGLAKYDLGYLRGLLAAGFEGHIRFFCSTRLDQPVPDEVELRPIFTYNGKRSAALKAISYLGSMLRLALDALFAPADIYHFQWFKLPWADYFFVLLLRKVAGVRVVMTAHNVVPHQEEGKRHRWLGRIYWTVDGVVVHNVKAAHQIAERFSVALSRISVIRHGPIKIEARGRSKHRRCIKRFAAACDLRFLFIGRGSSYKGLDVLLEAWTRFVKSAPGKPGLIVIGAVDKDLKNLAADVAREYAESLLVIDEYVAEADLYHAIRNADVAVLPHRRISQSGVLLTVLGRRIPVLVSPLPGLLEPFEFARVGWQFDGSVEGLVSSLIFLATHREQVTRVRGDEEAWRAVREAYAWRHIGSRAREIYLGLIDGKPRAAEGRTDVRGVGR